MTKAKRGINKKLTTAINKMIDEVMKEPEAPKDGEKPAEPKYTLTDKMKVLDRALKHEAIRLKVQDTDEGAFFQLKNGEGAEE